MTAPCDSTKGTCTTFSEEEFGKRMDRCLTDVLMKTSGGLVMGTIISLLIFRQRKWPIILGGGVGAGVAFSTCEHRLNAAAAADTENKQETYF
ncbi:MICOS complex subunit Mic10-like isoform X1 [Hermetia illucens]|uniref:MICOS complex subunit Mic10-like isoform X1 n=1 Tax=Hermetia illucens TaxID=343691 RepID=UPI0018CC25F4|nr:MICOS complex subunit Mic10-like isoform X1 [Hermetia illucens]XP_037922607.1 MICOS complex subunit Mic10-like isoform X1 [Hermetia illucens]XP_037922609.1 MICOS complex subunit Mic10-like isoform X1 [Hermetia illucens]XP_037922610.1 MICOS complex subunit Mic10-like isoform X1 [Hermetia illucens]XP_037922611.1 MICOS complex subunit Mic10-like isoform X1 [Hermetia illucens]XP_037922612.1 MICOS complex subunit Mic10-like isoform X1 [Hermetia illucens]XP_037922613.1 MICOS complex subunit Mic1